MNIAKKTPSHHEVENMARKGATKFQPYIKRWLTKTSTTTQQAGNINNLGTGTSSQNNQNNTKNEINIFENKIKMMNSDYNSKVKSFIKSDETFKIVTTNVNSVLNFAKRQKIWNLLKSDPDILLLTDTRVCECDLVKY